MPPLRSDIVLHCCIRGSRNVSADPDALYDEQLVGRIRRLEAKKAKLEREIFLLKKLRAENEKSIIPRRIRLRKAGLGRVAAHNRIIRFLEDHTKPMPSKAIMAALRKVDPDLKPSTFRSHMKRLTDAGVLKQEGARGSYVLVKRDSNLVREEKERSPKPFRLRWPVM